MSSSFALESMDGVIGPGFFGGGIVLGVLVGASSYFVGGWFIPVLRLVVVVVVGLVDPGVVVVVVVGEEGRLV